MKQTTRRVILDIGVASVVLCIIIINNVTYSLCICRWVGGSLLCLIICVNVRVHTNTHTHAHTRTNIRCSLSPSLTHTWTNTYIHADKLILEIQFNFRQNIQWREEESWNITRPAKNLIESNTYNHHTYTQTYICVCTRRGVLLCMVMCVYVCMYMCVTGWCVCVCMCVCECVRACVVDVAK